MKIKQLTFVAVLENSTDKKRMIKLYNHANKSR